MTISAHIIVGTALCVCAVPLTSCRTGTISTGPGSDSPTGDNLPGNGDSTVGDAQSPSDNDVADGGCDGSGCGDAPSDTDIRGDSIAFGDSSNPSANPCPEGQFLNLRDDTCYDLDTSFGFDLAAFSAQLGPGDISLATAQCNQAALLDALERLEDAGGGVLHLPACEIGLTVPIYLPSHSIVQGAGIGQTLLYVDSGWGTSGSVVRFYDASIYSVGWQNAGHQHIALRDLSIRGRSDVAANNIDITGSDNILIERVECYDAGKSALGFVHSQRTTIRYGEFHHSVAFHGVGNKDCYIAESMDGPDADNLVSAEECSGGDENYWAESYAVYSNRLHHNGGMGIDLHASFGEVAGNLVNSNEWSTKFPEPAHDIWVHDNLFDGGTFWGTKIGNQYEIADDTLTPHRQIYYRNRFANNGTYGVRVDRATEIYFIANEYENNGHDNDLRLTCPVGAVVACPGDEIAGARVAGTVDGIQWLDPTDSRCDLNLVADVFQ